MKIRWKTLIIAIAIPLLVGAVSGFITMGAMDDFSALNQPPLSPPAWLFPVAWTILYTLMGIASYLVFETTADMNEKRNALMAYFIQLGMNFLWPIFFFSLGLYLFSFFWLLALWVLVIVTAVLFYRISRPAGWLMLPYILWLTFAAYLNIMIYILN